MQGRGVAAKRLWRELHEASEDDLHFRDSRILGSMCTEPIPIARRAHAMFLEANLGNPGYYKGTWRLERETLRMLADLLHGKNLGGFTVSGATEGNITALWMARNTTHRKEIVASRTAHFSVRKAADLLGMRLVEIPHDSEYRLDVDALRKAVGRDTAAVVAVAGTTELGVVDPIDAIGETCLDRAFLHIDAAFGGFVLPFLEDSGVEVPPWDFRVAGVGSLVLDAHKMGMATIPASHLLVREAKHFEKIAVESPYLTSVYQTSLLGTRNSAGVGRRVCGDAEPGSRGIREHRRAVHEEHAGDRRAGPGGRDRARGRAADEHRCVPRAGRRGRAARARRAGVEGEHVAEPARLAGRRHAPRHREGRGRVRGRPRRGVQEGRGMTPSRSPPHERIRVGALCARKA